MRKLCFKCFRFFFKVFHLDVVKVDLDIAYIFKVFQQFNIFILSVSSGCYKSRSGCCMRYNDEICLLQAYVSIVSEVCCRCFIWMFQK